MFEGPFAESIVKRAIDKKLVQVQVHNLRKWAKDKRKTVDDRPYGGGVGMIMRVDVINAAIQEIKKQKAKSKNANKKSKIILLDATGEKFTQQKAQELAKLEHLILIAGHYEGVDHRVHEHLADEIISIGDYVLTGGEIPTMVLVDTIVRLIPGVLGKEASLAEESHSEPGCLEYHQYTRPEKYKGWKVPEILLSGNHKKISKWRQESQSPSARG